MTHATLDELRFPIGKFAARKEASAQDRAGWIDQIARAPEAVSHLVSGLTPVQLETPYRDDGWTIAQVVHHMADSHTNAYIRMRFAVAESNFTVKPYDEKRWALFPDATSTDVGPSLDLLRGLHARWVTLLRSFGPEEFERSLVHPEHGPITVGWLLQLYAWHGRHHAGHIAGARERHGF